MSHTPRDSRNPGRHGRSGTLPPVPGRPAPSPGDGGFGTHSFLTSLLSLFSCVLPLGLFVGFTWQVASHGPLRTADEQLGVTMRGSAPPTVLAELLADLGNMAVALPVLAGAMAYAGWRSRRWLSPLMYGLAMAAVPLCVSLLKAWLDRPGPLGGSGYYPSGHAATAAVAFGGAALLMAPWARGAWWLLPALASLLTLLNGVGLVWRGYHWPLDVLTSWCLSWLLLMTATAAVRRGLRRSGPPPAVDPGRG